MTVERQYPRNEESLVDLVRNALQPGDSIVVQAGHFLLIMDESTGQVIPCIADENDLTTTSPVMERFGRFPLLTWRLALQVLAQVNAPARHLMIVVNDWQYLNETAERSIFYKRNSGALPSSFQRELSQMSRPASLLLPPPTRNGVSTSPFFGEMNLRNRYQRRVLRLMRRGELPPETVVHKSDSGIACELPDTSGNLREIYCSGKSGDCTAEIAEMLYHASTETGAKCFLNFYPLVCRDFVELGTTRAVELFSAPLRAILNVGLPSGGVRSMCDLFTGCEASVHTFE